MEGIDTKANEIIDKVDQILNLICDKWKIQESKLVRMSPGNIVEIGGAIDLLISEKYIELIVDKKEKEKSTTTSNLGIDRQDIYTYYCPTIKGIIFNKNGGYRGDIERTKRKDFNLKIRNFIITSGSLLAGMYSLWKLFSHFDALLSVNLMTFLTVFFFGLIAGMIIYMLVLEVFSRKKDR